MRQSFADFLKHERKDASDAFLEGNPVPLGKITAEGVIFYAPSGDVFEGAAAVTKAFALTASRFAGWSLNDFEAKKMRVEESFATWVGIQHSVVIMAQSGKSVPYTLRLTEHYVFEDDGWKLAFRHASPLKETA